MVEEKGGRREEEGEGREEDGEGGRREGGREINGLMVKLVILYANTASVHVETSEATSSLLMYLWFHAGLVPPFSTKLPHYSR